MRNSPSPPSQANTERTGKRSSPQFMLGNCGSHTLDFRPCRRHAACQPDSLSQRHAPCWPSCTTKDWESAPAVLQSCAYHVLVTVLASASWPYNVFMNTQAVATAAARRGLLRVQLRVCHAVQCDATNSCRAEASPVRKR